MNVTVKLSVKSLLSNDITYCCLINGLNEGVVLNPYSCLVIFLFMMCITLNEMQIKSFSTHKHTRAHTYKYTCAHLKSKYNIMKPHVLQFLSFIVFLSFPSYDSVKQPY